MSSNSNSASPFSVRGSNKLIKKIKNKKKYFSFFFLEKICLRFYISIFCGNFISLAPPNGFNTTANLPLIKFNPLLLQKQQQISAAALLQQLAAASPAMLTEVGQWKAVHSENEQQEKGGGEEKLIGGGIEEEDEGTEEEKRHGEEGQEEVRRPEIAYSLGFVGRKQK